MSLVELRIRHLAVFDEAVVAVPPGFTALTGETGAGKSVCVAALRLALGGRVDGDRIAPGAPAAQVSAVFDDVPPAVRERLAGLGIAVDELTTLSRELSRSGRGCCRINAALVSQAVLREVGEALAEITVQGASQRLLQGSRQRDVLDLAAAASDLRAEVREAVARWREAQRRLEESTRLRAVGAAEIEAARAVVAELSVLRLVVGEEATLATERLRLRNAAALLAAGDTLRQASAGDEDQPGAADLLAAAVDACAGVAGVDEALDVMVAEAAALVDQVRELASSARHHGQTVALDEARVADVEARLDVLARVRRRHGSIEAALLALADADRLLEASSGSGDDLEEAQLLVTRARAVAGSAAARLSVLRHRAARRLERDVEAALHLLELPRARFQVVIERRADVDGVELDGATVQCGPAGVDDVEFRLAANRGAGPTPLDAGPSGGELSRLVLALSACVAESGSPLLVLDEVDTGIGGETAARVGDLLAATGRHRQVLAITHRAEIASRADAHLLVRKVDGAAGAAASVTLLDGEDRLSEIARLMSGRVTEAARARALELRGEAVATVASAALGGRRRAR